MDKAWARQPFAQGFQERAALGFILKPEYRIINVPDDDDIPFRLYPSPIRSPFVHHNIQKNVRQQRRNH